MNGFRRPSNQLRPLLLGQTFVEYTFVVAAIAVALIGSYKLMGTQLKFLMSTLGTWIAGI